MEFTTLFRVKLTLKLVEYKTDLGQRNRRLVSDTYVESAVVQLDEGARVVDGHPNADS